MKFLYHLLFRVIVAVMDIFRLELKDIYEHHLKLFCTFVCVVIDKFLKTIPLKSMIDEYEQLWLDGLVACDIDSHWLQQGRLNDLKL